jgi:hypothetical protein
MKLEDVTSQNDTIYVLRNASSWGETVSFSALGVPRSTSTRLILAPGHLSGDDHSGSLMERSNHDTWLEVFESGQGEWWADIRGDYGTFGVGVCVEEIPAGLCAAVADFLSTLQKYPIADDEAHSELVAQARADAWIGWASQKFVETLVKRFDIHDDFYPDDTSVVELFHDASDRIEEHWINRSGESMWIDVAKVAGVVTMGEMMDLLQSGYSEVLSYGNAG